MQLKMTYTLSTAINELSQIMHTRSSVAGWWSDPETGELFSEKQRNFYVPTKIALIHSEISEALEGFRKDKMDDHLPHRKSVEVELADAMIRIFDLAGALQLDLGRAILEKSDYNMRRADHKASERVKTGGKKF